MSAKELNPKLVVLEISATCSKTLIALFLLILGISGVLLLLIGNFWPVLYGILFLCLAGYAGWLLLKNPTWHLNFETGECLLVNSRYAPIKASSKIFLMRDYNRVFVHSRNDPVGSWSVTLSDIQGESLNLAPCVSREYAVEIARLLDEKFGLKNHGVIG